MSDELEQIKQLLSNGENIFITGGGGVGKSYLLNELSKFYKKELRLTSTKRVSAINFQKLICAQRQDIEFITLTL